MLYLKPVIMDLLAKEKRSIAFELIDFYFLHAKTLEDFDTLGYVSLKSEYRPMYLKCAEAAYSLATSSEQKFNARTNLYKAYNALNYPEKALFYINLNLQQNPDDFETQCQKAFNISLAGDKKTSEKILLELVEKNPNKLKDMKAAFSGKMLREGNTAEGIIAFIEAFKPKNKLFEEQLGMTRWDGKTYPGETVYLEGEGGIGDEIINIRFFDHIKDLGMKPILYSAWSQYRVDVVDLFRRHGHEVLTEPYSINTKCKWAPMMSIPGYMRLTENDLWRGPYMKPLRQEKNKLNSNKFKIGIKCNGNPYFSQDEYRKIPLDVILKNLPKEAEVYYIDKEVGHLGTIDLGDRIETWEDTLDFIDQMDCIVSSCTSLVHAAGAMGKTTFVAVPIAEYYIWTTTRTDTSSPWYGKNFQVHKQTKVRDWEEPLYNIGIEVKKLMEKK
jgi:tetratricopeptide (TPR) repeat protein